MALGELSLYSEDVIKASPLAQDNMNIALG